MLRIFFCSLEGKSKEWYLTLLPGSATTWSMLKRLFMVKYFPATKANQLKKQISNIEQSSSESFYDYYERFKWLCASCPFHGHKNKNLVMILHNRILNQERRIVDAACGGSILNLTPEDAMSKLQDLADGTRSFLRMDQKRVSNVVTSNNSNLSNKLVELKSMIKGLTLGIKPQERVCRIFTDPYHPTDSCLLDLATITIKTPTNTTLELKRLQIPPS